MKGIKKRTHRLVRVFISAPDIMNCWIVAKHYEVIATGEHAFADHSRRNGVPNLKYREGEWNLYHNGVVLVISSTNEVGTLVTRGTWADVYPAYKRYALMLMKE